MHCSRKYKRLWRGQTCPRPDGRWTVIEVECLGACGFATPVLVNDDFVESVTPEKVAELVRKYR